MILRFLCPALGLAAACAVAETNAPPCVDVFDSGTAGYASIRIPAIVRTGAGTLLAFAEGRVRPADQAENKIVLKRSGDDGKSWSALQVIAERGRDSLNNPCAVVEATSGRVLLMYQSYPAGAHEHGSLREGWDAEPYVHSWLIASDDDGKSWTPPQDVTPSVKHPKTATTVASGPGIGIQLKSGPHAGRLLVPFNEGPPGRWQVYATFSDDGGKTWACGENAPGAIVRDAKGREVSVVNEVQMVELADGAVRLNSRHGGGTPFRTTAVSRDGGRTWSKVEEARDLREPACMASVLRARDPADGAPGLLLYSGPAPDGRRDGALSASRDDGATWQPLRPIYTGGFAYSCLVPLPGGDVGCLFERDGYKHISFLRLPLEAAPQ